MARTREPIINIIPIMKIVNLKVMEFYMFGN